VSRGIAWGVVGVANRSVGRNWSRILEPDALAFAEKRKKNQSDKGDALQDNGNCNCALPDAAGAFFGLRIAFDEATAERSKAIFGHTGHKLDFKSHHTPP
jgi:hypothetical protein